MLDIGWQELFLIATFAILVVGPKDLPRMMKTVMMWVRKARGLAREFQSGVDEMVREADLDDLKKDVSSISKPGDLAKNIVDTVDPTGELGDIQKDMDKTAKAAIKEPPVVDPLKEPKSAEPENPYKNKSGDELRALMEEEKAKEAEVASSAGTPETENLAESKTEKTGETT
jgi:sec-independent protein translocase protein TatB